MYKRGDRRQEILWNKVLYMTILYLFEDPIQSVWNVSIKFDTWNNIETVLFYKKTVLRVNHININKCNDHTIYFYRIYERYEAPISCNTTIYLSSLFNWTCLVFAFDQINIHGFYILVLSIHFTLIIQIFILDQSFLCNLGLKNRTPDHHHL